MSKGSTDTSRGDDKHSAALEAGSAFPAQPSAPSFPPWTAGTVHPAESIPGSTIAAVGMTPGQDVTVVIAHPPALKSLGEAYLLCFPLGLLGLHHFYLRRYGFGVLYFCTLGVCGVGWLVDLVRMPVLVKEANHKILHPEEDVPSVSLCDAYITWFPLGIVGLHQYYLRRWDWGLGFTFTVGFFGIGWIVDAFRLPSLVRETNRRLELERTNTLPREIHLCETYALGVTPAGLFGAHHFYMKRYFFGVYYALTLGGCGIGWIVDWFRMKWLVHRANHPEEHVLGRRHKFIDDAYVMAFPLGIIGMHHFYLERFTWGVLYLFTLGLFGVGWLVDLCRMPCLVSDTNKRIEEELRVMAEIRQQIGVHPTALLHREMYYPPTVCGNGLSNHPQSTTSPTLLPPSYEESLQVGGSTAPTEFVAGGAVYMPSTTPHANANHGFEKDKF